MGKHLLKSLFMKVEATYKVNSNPTVDDVILAENVEINPLQMQTDDYTPVSDKFGDGEKIIGSVWSTVQFDVVVGGGGTPIGNIAGIPNHDAVLRAGAMSRVITPGTIIRYTPIDSGEESLSAVYHIDNARFALLGVRGELEWMMEAGKAPRMRFNGMGLRVPMTDASPAAYSLPARPRPLAMNNANTAVQIVSGSYNVRCNSLTLRLGNRVEYINRSGQEEIILSDRKSTGTISFELPSVATQDFLGAAGLCTLATQTTLFVQFGSTPGNRVTWFSPAVQLMNPRLGGDKGTSMLTCDLHVVKNSLQIDYW